MIISGHKVVRRVAETGPGTITIQFQALLFQLQCPNAEGVPIATVKLPNGETMTLLSFCGKSGWPQLRVPEKKGFKDICVLQLAGLLQFATAPRHPMKGQGTKFAAWGYQAGFFHTYLHHQTAASAAAAAPAPAPSRRKRRF